MPGLTGDVCVPGGCCVCAAGVGLLGKERQEEWLWQGGAEAGTREQAGETFRVGLRVLGTASPRRMPSFFFTGCVLNRPQLWEPDLQKQVHEMACFDILMPKSVVGPF